MKKTNGKKLWKDTFWLICVVMIGLFSFCFLMAGGMMIFQGIFHRIGGMIFPGMFMIFLGISGFRFILKMVEKRARKKGKINSHIPKESLENLTPKTENKAKAKLENTSENKNVNEKKTIGEKKTASENITINENKTASENKTISENKTTGASNSESANRTNTITNEAMKHGSENATSTIQIQDPLTQKEQELELMKKRAQEKYKQQEAKKQNQAEREKEKILEQKKQEQEKMLLEEQAKREQEENNLHQEAAKLAPVGRELVHQGGQKIILEAVQNLIPDLKVLSEENHTAEPLYKQKIQTAEEMLALLTAVMQEMNRVLERFDVENVQKLWEEKSTEELIMGIKAFDFYQQFSVENDSFQLLSMMLIDEVIRREKC